MLTDNFDMNDFWQWLILILAVVLIVAALSIKAAKR
jgi:hypothetical protein